MKKNPIEKLKALLDKGVDKFPALAEQAFNEIMKTMGDCAKNCLADLHIWGRTTWQQRLTEYLLKFIDKNRKAFDGKTDVQIIGRLINEGFAWIQQYCADCFPPIILG